MASSELAAIVNFARNSKKSLPERIRSLMFHLKEDMEFVPQRQQDHAVGCGHKHDGNKATARLSRLQFFKRSRGLNPKQQGFLD